MINIEAPNWQNSEVLTLNLANNFFLYLQLKLKGIFYLHVRIWITMYMAQPEMMLLLFTTTFVNSEIESGSTLKIFFLNMSAPRNWNNSKMSYFKRLVSKKVKAKNRDQLTPKISFTWCLLSSSLAPPHSKEPWFGMGGGGGGGGAKTGVFQGKIKKRNPFKTHMV